MNESTLRQKGLWTNWISRQTNIFRRELLSEIVDEPKGRKRALLELVVQQYGVLLCMNRRLKGKEIVNDAGLVPMLGKQYLAWVANFNRNVEALVANMPSDALTDIPAIDERFKSGKD